MPAIDPDDLPKKKTAHELGQDLALLSVNELGERIALLKDEIVRLGRLDLFFQANVKTCRYRC